MKKISLILLFALFCSIHSSYGQYNLSEKRIYLLDITASMEGRGMVETPNIFDDVKQKLSNAVSQIGNDNTEVVIIPFTNVPYEPIRGYTNNIDSLVNQIDQIGIKRGDTNIADAWSRGIAEISPSKINYLFLLTDGLHNDTHESSVLYERLRGWGDVSKDNYFFAFYVMLTPNAKEQEICNIVDELDQMWLIESMDVGVTFITTTLNISNNVNNSKIVRINLESKKRDIQYNNIGLNIEIDDNPYYKIDSVNAHLNEGYIDFELVELIDKIDIPIEYDAKIKISYNKKENPLLFIIPEVLNFNMLNSTYKCN